MKKTVSMLLSVFILASLFVPFSSVALSENDYEYFVTDNGVTIKKYLGSNETVTIPEIIANKNVIGIGNQAFSNCSSVKSIIIPSSIIRLEPYALYNCPALESIFIGSNVRIVGGAALSSQNLKQIIVDPTNAFLSTDENSVLFNKDKTKLIAYPAGIETTSYIMPDSVKAIERFAFYNISHLNSITLSKGISVISSYAFNGCINLKNVDIPDNVKVIGDYAFRGCGFDNIVIPDSVTRIEMAAFAGCIDLKTIRLSSSLKYIGYAAFGNCKSLESITLPNGVEEIHKEAFINCIGLLNVAIPDSVVKVGVNAFYNTPFLNNRSGERYVMESGILMKYNKSAPETAMPNDIRVIGAFVFSDIFDESFIVPEGVTHICEGAFFNSKIESIILPESLRYIGANAFGSCPSLRTINIPDGVDEIDTNPFRGTEWYKNINDEFVIVGDGVLIGYKGSSNIINIPYGVKYISSLLNAYNEDITEIIIPGSVNIIGRFAFASLEGLSKIVIPDSVTIIKDSAFLSCTKLTDVTIGANIKEIYHWAFSDSLSLKSITIKGNIEYIGFEAIAFIFPEMSVIEDFILYGEKGTALEDYALAVGISFIPTNNKSLYIDGEYLKGASEGIRVSDIKELFASATINDNKGKILGDNEAVGTGYEVTDGNSTYKILIMGDANGDGKVNAIDYMITKRVYLGTHSIEGVYLKAICINGEDKPTPADYMKIKRHFLGTYNLYD